MSRQLLEYWRARKGGAAMPRRADLDLISDLPRLAAYVLLIEVGEGPRFRYRIVGSALVERAHRDVTGRELDRAIYGEHIDEVLAPLRTVVAEKRPVRVRAFARGVERAPTRMEFLCVPLAGDDPDRVAYILGVLSFERGSEPAFETQAGESLRIELL
jgi:hypothetical protein